jgi:hypothetical protein
MYLDELQAEEEELRVLLTPKQLYSALSAVV